MTPRRGHPAPVRAPKGRVGDGARGPRTPVLLGAIPGARQPSVWPVCRDFPFGRAGQPAAVLNRRRRQRDGHASGSAAERAGLRCERCGTIFVPLTFLTGFFGMNFGWMVDQIDSPIAFWLLGVLIPIATGVLSWRLLVRRFLIGDDGQPRH